MKRWWKWREGAGETEGEKRGKTGRREIQSQREVTVYGSMY